MASSAHKQLQDWPMAAPPPTPSTQTPNNNLHFPTTAAAADTLARLLHRLPPTLSLPTRPPPSVASPPPLISLSEATVNPLLLSSSSELGFFQLTDHAIPPQLATSAESQARSLFTLNKEEKESHFPRNWPLGFLDRDEDDEIGESLCLDANSLVTESTQSLSLGSLNELARGLEKLGLEIVDKLATMVGFSNPFSEDPTRMCSLLWISESTRGDNPVGSSGGSYPYVVALQYQIRCEKYVVLGESGPVSVLPQVDSVMVAVGDIAHVWSNGKLKRVKGIPKASSSSCSGDKGKHFPYVTMSLLLTLPLDATVSPLLPTTTKEDEDEDDSEGDLDRNHEGKEKRLLFTSFLFEDHAWRAYHDRLAFQDSLDRYRCQHNISS